MGIEYLKRKVQSPAVDSSDVRSTVSRMIAEIEHGGEDKVLEYAAKLDGWTGVKENVVLSADVVTELCSLVPEAVKEDIRAAHREVKAFAEHQRNSMKEFEATMPSGLICGQRLIPVQVAGCYVPGGRFAHVASAIMSCTTAKVAGVDVVVCCSPPRRDSGTIHPAVVFAAIECGADVVMVLGGVQALAAMAFGHFHAHGPCNVLVGPGNRYVAEAKRVLFGQCGIDLIAGPTEIMVLADESADANIVATDIVSQCEHGFDSPGWLVTTSRALAEEVMRLIPRLIEELPEDTAAGVSWRDYGEVIVCETREEAVKVSDEYAAEHLQVLCNDLEWWHTRLRNYGSLFLGEGTTVTYGDKCSGPNHILPTRRVAYYSGGLNVMKFIKQCTYQRMPDRNITRTIAPLAARISRVEGMEGHARSADVRLEKYFPGESFLLSHDYH